MRAAVEEQGGLIGQPELDFLAEVRTWGNQTYEFANFTDEELADAMMSLAAERGTSTLDRASVLTELATQRDARQDISVALGRLRLHSDKARLAELLIPTLVRHVEAPAEDKTPPPIVELVLAARDKVTTLLGGTYVLAGEDE